ncbi:MAG: 4Fe-4S binding protein [Acidobacteria bacterium]|nr:4Fe-4S binding protein [Acidobacteriota bacterium]
MSKVRIHFTSPKIWRHAVMIFFFVFLLHVAYDHQGQGGGPRGTPSVEAYCPFGGLESLYQFLTTGGFIRRIEPSAMILFAALVLLTLLFSRGFCGWICPFGSLQEWLGLLGRKIFRKKYNPTGAWDRALRYLKYVILAVIIALTWHMGALVFRDYDPFLAFFHLGAGMAELPWAYAILGAVLAASLYIERFFCKYACPLGAVLGVLGKAGLTKVQREPDGCKGCNICQKKCHAHVDFLSVTTIRDSECNHCMDCVVDCPKPNVLTVRGPRWKFSHPVYASLLVLGLFALIGASQLAGKWQTRPAAVSFANNAGKLDPENIRGWMTLQEISGGYGIPVDELYKRSGIPARVAATARLNTVARTYQLEFEPDRVREIVRGYLAGAPARKDQGQKDHGSGSEEEVKGFMTLNEIALKTGVPKDYLLKTLGLSEQIDARQPVREWMHAHGKSIQDLRDAVKSHR